MSLVFCSSKRKKHYFVKPDMNHCRRWDFADVLVWMFLVIRHTLGVEARSTTHEPHIFFFPRDIKYVAMMTVEAVESFTLVRLHV